MPLLTLQLLKAPSPSSPDARPLLPSAPTWLLSGACGLSRRQRRSPRQHPQEAERRIPVNYSSRYQAGALARQSYLPFKVCRM